MKVHPKVQSNEEMCKEEELVDKSTTQEGSTPLQRKRKIEESLDSNRDFSIKRVKDFSVKFDLDKFEKAALEKAALEKQEEIETKKLVLGETLYAILENGVVPEESIETFPPDCKLALYLYMKDGKSTLGLDYETRRIALGEAVYTVLGEAIIKEDTLELLPTDWMLALDRYMKHEKVALKKHEEYKEKYVLLLLDLYNNEEMY